MRTFVIAAVMTAVLIVPAVSVAQVGAPSGGIPTQIVPCDGTPSNPCDWEKFIELMQRILNFMVFLGVALSALLFAYAGFLYLTSGGDSGKVSSAREIFGHVVMGLIIMLVAWLLVDTLLRTLTGRGFQERNLQAPGASLTTAPYFGTVSAHDTESPRKTS